MCIIGAGITSPFLFWETGMADDDAVTSRARADLCRFLAACYYQPCREFVEEKLFDSMLEAAGRIHPQLAAVARRLGKAFSAEALESLLIDYTRLFLGPTDALAKPYGSVWLTGEKTLMQDSTMAVLELYQEGGFDMDEEFRELPDHVAAELEFLYLLIHKENEARMMNDTEAAAAARELKARFLEEHVGKWISPFAAALRTGAQSPFYRELADLTERFVAMQRVPRDGA